MIWCRVLVFVVTSLVTCASGMGTILRSYEGVVAELPSLAMIETASAQICLHKCALTEVCNVVTVGWLSSSSVVCIFAYTKSLSEISEHLHSQKGFSVYELPKKSKQQKLPRPDITPTVPPGCQGNLYLQNEDNGMFIAYDEAEELFVLRNAKEPSQKFCETKNNIYLVSKGKCLFKEAQKVVISSDCSNANAAMSFTTKHPADRIESGGMCLRTNHLSNVQHGAFLYFSSDCNDNRLRYAKVTD